MFRVEVVEASGGITMTVEGRFVGVYADEAKQLIVRRKIPADLTVDISEVTYVDSVGELALTWLRQIGAKFVADNSYSLDVCERLHLPVIKNRDVPPESFSGAQAW